MTFSPTYFLSVAYSLRVAPILRASCTSLSLLFRTDLALTGLLMSTIVHLPFSARAVLSGGGAAAAWAPGQQSGAGKTGWGLSLAARKLRRGAALQPQGCCGCPRFPAHLCGCRPPGGQSRTACGGLSAEQRTQVGQAAGGLCGVGLRGRCQDSEGGRRGSLGPVSGSRRGEKVVLLGRRLDALEEGARGGEGLRCRCTALLPFGLFRGLFLA